MLDGSGICAAWRAVLVPTDLGHGRIDKDHQRRHEQRVDHVVEHVAHGYQQRKAQQRQRVQPPSQPPRHTAASPRHPQLRGTQTKQT